MTAAAAVSAEAPRPAVPHAFKRALWSGVVRVAANVLMLAAVFFAMYQAAQRPGSSLATFSLYFFGITVPLWLAAGWLLRFIRRRFPCEDATLVALPGRKAALTRWRVRARTEETTLQASSPDGWRQACAPAAR